MKLSRQRAGWQRERPSWLAVMLAHRWMLCRHSSRNMKILKNHFRHRCRKSYTFTARLTLRDQFLFAIATYRLITIIHVHSYYSNFAGREDSCLTRFCRPADSQSSLRSCGGSRAQSQRPSPVVQAQVGHGEMEKPFRTLSVSAALQERS